jgi:hypothetical protein
MDPAVKAAIATIAEDAWTMIEYPNAIRDETSAMRWLSMGFAGSDMVVGAIGMDNAVSVRKRNCFC